MIKLADIAESLMKIAGNLRWDSPEYNEKANLLDSVLNDILPNNWGDVENATCEDGSEWRVWTW